MNEEFFLLEGGGVARLVDKVTFYSLNENGEWIHNQRAISIFVDDPKDYIRLSENEVNAIIDAFLCQKFIHERTPKPSPTTVKELTALRKRVYMPKARERLETLLKSIQVEESAHDRYTPRPK